MSIKKMDIKKFKDFGYLQELNRQFLHPLGLALEVEENSCTGVWRIETVWEERKDPEGIIFGESVTSKSSFKEKADRVKIEQERIKKLREEKLGYNIQPV